MVCQSQRHVIPSFREGYESRLCGFDGLWCDFEGALGFGLRSYGRTRILYSVLLQMSNLPPVPSVFSHRDHSHRGYSR
jgi:hypothetical protein